jgi:SpoVK/Ycf46/Vps4 family AAA+-type ATPase
MLRKTGLLEFWEPTDIEDVGGLGELKKYIYQRSNALLSQTSELPKPRAILLCGVPGTGKSLSCKATANILGWPLIRLDIGALKGSLVGESEQKMRQATKIIDAFGQAVVWIDEVEKAFAGSSARNSMDSGTSAGMFSHWLTWLQETASPILVMTTANDIQALPPEFLRTGRFDTTFFVDLPGQREREEIIQIINGKYGSEIPKEFATTHLEGFTGAEIEQLAKDSLFDGLDDALHNLVPISQVMKEQVEGLRKWSKSRARLANTLDVTPDNRKIKEVNP